MIKIRELLRLYCEVELSARQIALSLNVSHTIVNSYIKMFKESNLEYEHLLTLGDKEMLEKLSAIKYSSKPSRFATPDFSVVRKELSRKGVTLELLHEEYVLSNPNNHYGYTSFCNHYNAYTKKLSLSMRQTHLAGEKVFIDYSGARGEIIDAHTGEVRSVEIFVAVLGASGYPFVIATLSQNKSDFIEAHNAMFRAFGGVPKLLVPDNLKSAVTTANKYEPDINPDYARMAKHYGCAIFPARPYKPRDKALVENAVKLVQRWILAKIRHHRFFTLGELNSAIAKLLEVYRGKVIKRVGKSRRELFLEIDKPALLPLPTLPYEYLSFKLLKVSIDYHICLDHCMYSVPYQLVGKKVEVWHSQTRVSICYEGKEISSHPRLQKKGSYSTQEIHMSEAHKKHSQWTPQRIIQWGGTIGVNTASMFELIMSTKPHPEMGYRACLGIMREFNMSKVRGWSEEKLDDIASIAIRKKSLRVKQIKELLKLHEVKKNNGSSSSDINLFTADTVAANNHINIRGSEYYKQQTLGEINK